MIKYVNGFMFSPDYKRVVLIRKQKPSWQKGKLNGVGGKVEAGETFSEAMTREFWEEAGVKTLSWRDVLTMTHPDQEWTMRFFMCTGDVDNVKSCTDEPIEIHDVGGLDFDNCIDHLAWIIPLCINGCYNYITNTGMGDYCDGDFSEVDVLTILKEKMSGYSSSIDRGYFILQEIRDKILGSVCSRVSQYSHRAFK